MSCQGTTAFRLVLRASDEDDATAWLWALGTQGIEVEPGAEGEVVLLAYFPARPDLEADLRTTLAARPGFRLEPAAVPDIDWVARFREVFQPFHVGGFRVAAPWNIPAGLAGGERLLVIDPGRAFGTGTHETTRLCLRALEALAQERRLGRALDVGTGTGILAVAASLLGARPVIAVDNDRDSIDSARLHARLNHAPALDLVLGDGGRPFANGRFDLILANLTAPLLRQRRDEIRSLLAPGAAVILSGLLIDDLDEIREAYAPLEPLEVRTDGDWAAVVGRSAP